LASCLPPFSNELPFRAAALLAVCSLDKSGLHARRQSWNRRRIHRHPFQFGVVPDENHPIEQIFTGGGKMSNYKRQEPQNTTVSSVIVLGTYPLRQNRIRLAIRQRQGELGRETTLDEDLEFYEAIPESPELRRVRVVVYENPFARIPFRQDLFRGPFDERWGVDGEFMRRVYVGSEVAAIESVLGES
jgi:hypothetical protein